MSKPLLSCVAATLIVACAPATPGPEQPLRVSTPVRESDCFSIAMVHGYEPVGRETIRFDTGPSGSYEVDISGGQCAEFDWSEQVALESSSSSLLCVGNHPGQGNISFRSQSSGRLTTCHIDDVRRARIEPDTLR